MSSSRGYQEGPLLQKVEEGLKRAVQMHSDGLEWDEDGKRIKKQKYTDLAVDHFTDDGEPSPVTRSWYLYGRSMPAAPSGIGVFRKSQTGPDYASSTLYEAGLDDIARFFLDEAGNPELNETYWRADIFDFLEVYYTHRAPPEYRAVYLANLDVRSEFEEVEEEIKTLIMKQEISELVRADGGDDEDFRQVDSYDEMGTSLSRMLIAVNSPEHLNEASTPLREYIMLVLKVFRALSLMELDDLEETHLHCIRGLETFYEEDVWTYIASIMSQRTAEGPKADVLEEWAENNIQKTRADFEAELEKQEQQCRGRGLLPDVDEFPQQDSADKAIRGLMRSIDQDA